MVDQNTKAFILMTVLALVMTGWYVRNNPAVFQETAILFLLGLATLWFVTSGRKYL